MSEFCWGSELPEYLQLIYSREEIALRNRTLGVEIGHWAEAVEKQYQQPLLAVCVLRGAVFFFADIVRTVPFSVESAFCRTWSYSSKDNEKMKGVRVSVETVMATGRSILLIDDICDTGATLSKLHQVFVELGAREVRSAVLIHRKVEDPQYLPNWSAFDYEGDKWFVGYGMENKNKLQNLPAVYTIQK